MNWKNKYMLLAAVVGAALAVSTATPSGEAQTRPNILLITADDMNFDSLGVTGCSIPGITPNLDKLASEGIRFDHAHVNIASCMPCRSVLMTGMYPHKNGGLGFDPIREDVTTLTAILHEAGYLNGIFGKTTHIKPVEKFKWDVNVHGREFDDGRNHHKFYRETVELIEKAKKKNRPFFLMANSHAPHRPFVERLKPSPKSPYKASEVEIPGFLPDTPEVRQEVAEYYTSVKRCDEIVGEVLRALADSKVEDETLVVFLSDHGMHFPYAKLNVYMNSTRTPLIVKWPGKIAPQQVDTKHMISGIDLMPTLLDILDLELPDNLDGVSYAPLLNGKTQKRRDQVFTFMNKTLKGEPFPMRSVQNKKFGYIYNGWSDGELAYLHTKNMIDGFLESANPEVANRGQFYRYRMPEEFYDYENDPNALNNLIDDPACQEEIARMRESLLEMMQTTGDPLLELFETRLESVQ